MSLMYGFLQKYHSGSSFGIVDVAICISGSRHGVRGAGGAVILLLRGRLITSGDFFGCHGLREGVLMASSG